MTRTHLAGLLMVAALACNGGGTDSTDPVDTDPVDTEDTDVGPPTDCDTCLASGGTWQPDECTQDCALQDASCFTDACPPACEDDCSGCFTQSACEAESCTWHQEAEAMWCTD